MHTVGTQVPTTGWHLNPHSWLVISSTQLALQPIQMVTQSTQLAGTQVLTAGTPLHTTGALKGCYATWEVSSHCALLLTMESVLASEHTSDDYSVLSKQRKLQLH